MPVTLRSYAKINLGLAIGPVRPDGLHALTTLYQTIAAHDLVTVAVRRGADTAAPSTVEITCGDPRVPRDGRNTVAKMLALALAAPGRGGLEVTVEIEKRLPVEGGLGGGSANAAAALIGLEHELRRMGCGQPLTGAERLRMAAIVGSDVPLFLLGGTVLGLGRGESVVPLPDLFAQPRGLPCPAAAEAAGLAMPAAEAASLAMPAAEAAGQPVVIALPTVGVATPAAFRAWDAAQAARGLTPEALAGRLEELSRALAAAWCEQHATGVFRFQAAGGDEDRAGTLLSTLVQTGILLNDFEEVVFRQHPLLEQIKRALCGGTIGETAVGCIAVSNPPKPALCAALSGSGSAVFGVYADIEGAHAAEERLSLLGIRSLRTQTLGRAEYWSAVVVREG